MNSKQIKILLVNPPTRESLGRLKDVPGATPPLGLCYVASYLIKHDFDVSLIDAFALNLTSEDLEDHIRKANFDIVGVSAYTPTLYDALEVLKIAKKLKPHALTILGGVHVTALPEKTVLNNKIVDVGVIGEGEQTLLEIAEKYDQIKKDRDALGKIHGVVYLKDGKVKKTKPRDFIKNLDDVPFPPYELLPMDKYNPQLHHSRGYGKEIKLKPHFAVVTGRGCPYNCTFCASQIMWHKKIRLRSSKNVLDEIDILVNDYGIRHIAFNDDTFTIDKNRTIKILDSLIERNYDLSMTATTRVDCIDSEILDKMKKAGFFLVRFGVESGSQEILNKMRKGITLEQIKKAVSLAKKAGLGTSATYIIGHPGETDKTAESTIRFACELDTDQTFFFIAIPFPGSDLYEIVVEKNLLQSADWGESWIMTSNKPLIKTETLSSRDLLELQKRAYSSFYFRPRYILNRLKSGVKNPKDLLIDIKGLKAMLKV